MEWRKSSDLIEGLIFWFPGSVFLVLAVLKAQQFGLVWPESPAARVVSVDGLGAALRDWIMGRAGACASGSRWERRVGGDYSVLYVGRGEAMAEAVSGRSWRFC